MAQTGLLSGDLGLDWAERQTNFRRSGRLGQWFFRYFGLDRLGQLPSR
jgi:hypothetical protein